MAQERSRSTTDMSLRNQILKKIAEINVICLIAFAIFLFIALISFDTADSAWSHAATTDVVQNKAGPVGAWIADILLYLFGYLGYLSPFLLVYSGWGILSCIQQNKGIDYQYYSIKLTGFLFAFLSALGLACLYFYTNESLPLAVSSAGGVLGSAVGDSLFVVFGLLGSTLILLTILLIGITLFTDFSWLWLIDFLGHWFFELFDYVSDLVEVGRDYFEGRRAKHQREIMVKIEQEKIKDRDPVRIEPVISTLEVSDRVEKEKQVPLFNLPVEGTLPPLDLLAVAKPTQGQYSDEALAAISRQIELKLKDFNIDAQVVEVLPGPVITRFEIQPAAGVKGSQIINLTKDIARSLSVVSVRVVDIIPGKSVIGLEFPNENREIVALSDVLRSKEYDEMQSFMTIGLGKDISGKPMVADIGKMPHLLVAGTTGSGKSVALNVMILSLLYKTTAKNVRLIMIDPKMLELSVYDGIPHLLAPVVTDMKEAANALRWCVAEMERRYAMLSSVGVRNITGYNRKIAEANSAGEPIPDSSYKPISEEDPQRYLEHLPYIVVVVDELADMMMTTGKKVEELIARLAQKARAAGIHLILATQRPSVDVITGLIKANIPSRIAFQVSSKIDSRTILDQMGAENLLGHGDMLYLPGGTSIPTRIHGAFVDDHEVHAVVEEIKSRGEASYNDDVLRTLVGDNQSGSVAGEYNADGEQDVLYDEAAQIVSETRKASISYIQRRLKIGYNRAARIIEDMERSGLVSTANSNGTREVLVPPPQTD
ncbi:Cell division protein FtsK [uncultured Candidatus Thioglobus sp.]|nr:Cell division protein FtsK [uncultured Candidatus Thioglobus sp.]